MFYPNGKRETEVGGCKLSPTAPNEIYELIMIQVLLDFESRLIEGRCCLVGCEVTLRFALRSLCLDIGRNQSMMDDVGAIHRIYRRHPARRVSLYF